MTAFQNLFQTLYNIGLYDVMLPFMLIFVLVFAILQKSKVLAKGSDAKDLSEARKYNAIVALVMGLIVVIPHTIGLYPSDANPVVIINSSLPFIGVILVALIAVFLIIGLFGAKTNWGGAASGWVALLSFIAVGYIFGYNAGWFRQMPSWLLWLQRPDTQALVIVFGVFGLIIYFITRDPEEAAKSHTFKDGMEGLGKLFGGK